MRRENDHEALEVCFGILVLAALEGRRCPMNGTTYMDSIYTTALARQGKIKVEISGRNYRTVTILIGENAGIKTTPDPTGMRIWHVIDATGPHKTTARSGAVPRPSRASRQAPSAPKSLPPDWDYRV